jgi:hypothetical protein
MSAILRHATRRAVAFDGDVVGPRLAAPAPEAHHSHSIVAGGFDEMSSVTRLMPRTSLIRFDTLARSSCGSGARRAPS